MSCALICAAPAERTVSSTCWARSARSSSETGRPWQALRTPATTFSRLNGSMTPDRLTTERLDVSMVVKRRWQAVHSRRRRIAEPSSAVRESITLESAFRQNGQCTPRSSSVGRAAGRHRSGARYGRATARCNMPTASRRRERGTAASAGGDEQLLAHGEVAGLQAVDAQDVVDDVADVLALGRGGTGDPPEGVPGGDRHPLDRAGVGLPTGHDTAEPAARRDGEDRGEEEQRRGADEPAARGEPQARRCRAVGRRGRPGPGDGGRGRRPLHLGHRGGDEAGPHELEVAWPGSRAGTCTDRGGSCQRTHPHTPSNACTSNVCATPYYAPPTLSTRRRTDV